MLSPLRYMGGKSRQAEWIVRLIPSHYTYVEPFGGAAHVLFAKGRSSIEVYNDINQDVVNFFAMLRDRSEELVEKVSLIPYARKHYEEWTQDFKAGRRPAEPLEWAARWFYLNRASVNGRWGAGWSHRLKGKGGGVKEWAHIEARLYAAAQRLRGVQIENEDFRAIFQTYDSPETFFYADPPYFGMEDYYHFQGEFTKKDHEALAEILKKLKGRWLLSYNLCPEVKELYAGFSSRVLTYRSTAPITKGKSKPYKQEIYFANYDLNRSTLFAIDDIDDVDNVIEISAGGEEDWPTGNAP